MISKRASVLILCCVFSGSPSCGLHNQGMGMGDVRPDGTDMEMDHAELTPEERLEERLDPADLEPVEEMSEDDAEGHEEAAEDGTGDEIEVLPETIEDTPEQEEAGPPCEGAVVGGFCWYASDVNESCDSTCAAHGGCNITGTRFYAGSNGTDNHCVEVLNALGFGGYEHWIAGDNQFGCHFAWGIYTYWSTTYPTNCEDGCPGCLAEVVRMCACNE